MNVSQNQNYTEYGDVVIPRDMDDLRLVAAKDPEGQHIMAISMRLFYRMAQKCLAYDLIMEKVNEKKEGDKKGEDTAKETPGA